jgi:hypothetical protein
MMGLKCVLNIVLDKKLILFVKNKDVKMILENED